MSYSYSAAR